MAYTPINWDELTPINLANLNKMDNAIDSNDNKLDNIDSNGDGKVDNADNAQKLGGAERSAFVEDSVAAEGNFTGETFKKIVLDNESSVAHKHYVISALEEADTSSVNSVYVGFYSDTTSCVYLYYASHTYGGTLDNIDYELSFRSLDADHTYYYKVLRLEG